MKTVVDNLKGKTQPGETKYLRKIKTQQRLLSSIHKISGLLTRPVSLDRILTSIVEETSSAFGFSRVAIFLVDKERELLECKYLIGFRPQERERALTRPFRLDRHECLETLVVKSGNTIFVKDHGTDSRLTKIDQKVSRIQNRVSTLAVPLKIKREIIGLIEADRDDVVLDIKAADIRSFSVFANQASIVIENARLREQNERRIEQLLFLQQMSKEIISSTLSLKQLLSVITANALKIAKSSMAALLMLEEDKNLLRVAAQKGYPDRFSKFQSRVGEGLCGHVAESLLPVLVKDAAAEPRHIFPPGVAASELALPLVSESKIIGVLLVSSPEKAAFTNDDLEVMTIFASHAATLIDNVRLYEQVTTQRNFVENILESSPNGIVTTDCKRRIRSINRRAEEIFCLKRADVFGKRLSEVFEAPVREVFDLAFDKNQVVDNREISLDSGNSENPVALGISTSLLRNHQNRITGVIATLQDLTTTKKTEELIRRMDRLSSLGQLSAGIAHEIRNPLASINFNVQMLAKKLPLDDRLSLIIQDTMEGIDRIKTLVKGILDFTKPKAPALAPGSLEDVLLDSISLMRSQFASKDIQVQVDLNGAIPEIIFDPHQIRQVFINLFLNAIEAMPGGGVLEVGSKMQKDLNGGESLAISICDSGMGIPNEYQSRIFDPFFTTKPEGTGLGLSIVHRILEQHDATIDVNSAVRKGTTFTLTFSIRKGGAEDAAIQDIDRR